jgi:hypothetical protein
MPRVVFALSCLGLFAAWLVLPALGEALPQIKDRLLEDIKYLASDELEGRGVGSSGLNLAAEFIKKDFAKAGLAIDRVEGSAFQKFDIVSGSKLVDPNLLQLTGPDGKTIDLKIGTDVEVCSFAGSGSFDADVVFCGYGINTQDEKPESPHGAQPEAGEKSGHPVKPSAPEKDFAYDDFNGIDVSGKVVIVMRRNPRQADPNSPLGASHGISRFADLRTKMKQAAAHKAAAVLFVNEPFSARKAEETRRESLNKSNEKVEAAAEEFLVVPPAESEKVAVQRSKLADAVNQTRALRDAAAKANDDVLMKFGYAGNGDGSLPPAFHLSAKLCNQMLASVHTDLTKLEGEIDSDLKPRSMVVSGWKVKGTANVEKVRTDVFNVIGVIDGEGPLADETVIVGAHYDHVGRGGQNSLAPGSTEIHNGADDNASGAVTLLELARRFGEQAKAKKPARRLVFIAFTGEELGLLGSEYYCKHPVFPLDKTVAMLNMDMVGRLKEEKLIVYGTGTSPRWEPELNQFNAETGFKLLFKPEGFGPSDHSSFYKEKIPVLHFFTGEHSDYHKPTDDWEKINIDGVARVAELMQKMIASTLEQPQRPEYVAVKGTANPNRSGNRPYVGTLPDFGNEEPGYAISGVAPGSPAEKGGLKGGDRIVKLGTVPVSNLDDYDAALRKFTAGEEVNFVVIREKQEVTLKVKLDPPR